MQSNTNTHAPLPSGLVPRVWARLFGTDAARLREKMQAAHWLSYVLILSQSAAVLLVFGHAELPLLASPLWTVQLIAALGVFVLLASVFAADMALLLTLRRMPALARNRQRWALREHLAYTIFVLATEAITLGVVLATLDADPAALISARPLIPPDGLAFRLQIVLRVLLVSWTAVQLVIVRGKLPVLLSTLTATGREIVGAHVERKLAALDISAIHLPAAFRVYAAMSRPPRRVRTLWNGWLVRRELSAEAEEERQVANVVDALDELAQWNRDVAEAEQQQSEQQQAHPPLPAPSVPERPPTGPGAPAAARPRAPRRQRPGKARRSDSIRLIPVPAEERVRAAWGAMPLRTDGRARMSNTALSRDAGVSSGTASKWVNILRREDELAILTARQNDDQQQMAQ